MKHMIRILFFLCLISNVYAVGYERYTADSIKTNTTKFSNILSTSTYNVQLCLERFDTVVSSVPVIPASIKVSTISALNINGINILDDSSNLGIKLRDGGNIGIGVTNPSSKLEIGGSALTGTTPALKISGSFDDGNYNDIGGERKIGVFYWGNLFMSMNLSYDATLLAYTRESPIDKCAVTEWATNGDINFRTAPSGNIGIAVTPTTVMKITNIGNVGIGTISPIEKLDVTGGIKSDVMFMIDSSNNDKWRIIVNTTTHTLDIDVDSGSGYVNKLRINK